MVDNKECKCTLWFTQEHDLVTRAEAMLTEADKIECRSFVTAQDVVHGNYKLNLAFVANLYNMYPSLDTPDATDMEIIPETREEKSKSLKVNLCAVNSFCNRNKCKIVTISK